MTDPVPAPAELLRRLRPIPTYRDHPATTGCDVDGVAPDGGPLTIGIVGSAEPVLLLFLSSSCLGCRDLWEGADELRLVLGPGVRVVVVTKSPGDEDVAAIRRLAIPWAGHAGAEVAPEVVMSSQAYLDYGVGGPPFYALAIGTEVRTEGVAWGVRATAEAARSALGAPESP